MLSCFLLKLSYDKSIIKQTELLIHIKIWKWKWNLKKGLKTVFTKLISDIGRYTICLMTLTFTHIYCDQKWDKHASEIK